MAETHSPTAKVKFGPYEVDLHSAELWKHGSRLRLQEQPFLVLKALLERPGELVTREELQRKIWPAETFVDFDHGLYSAVTRLRETLNDSADKPRYIETLARKGYRFIAEISEEILEVGAPVPVRIEPESFTKPRRRFGISILVGLLIVVVCISIAVNIIKKPYTLVVMPFAVPPQPIYESVAEGIPKNITRSLAAVDPTRLAVKSLAVAASAKSRSQGAVALGRELGADAVLLGSLTREGASHVLTIELVRVSDGAQLWGTQYADTDINDLVFLPDEIVTEVAAHLPLNLTQEQRASLTHRETRSRDAEQLMDRASALFWQVQPSSLRKCIEYSQHAIELDPTYARPYGEIASAYTVLGVIGDIPPQEAHDKAVEWSRKALHIDSSHMLSNIALLGEQWSYDWDWKGIEQAGIFHPFYNRAQEVQGHFDELLPRLKQETENKAADPVALFMYGRALYYHRDFNAAIAELQKASELAPAGLWIHMGLGYAYAQKKMWREAEQQFRAARPMSELWALSGLGYVEGASGHRRRALNIAQEIEQSSAKRYVSPLFPAHIYIGAGDANRAFLWLDRACRERTPHLTDVKIDAIYDPLRSDARFSAILRCVNLGS